MVSINSLAFLPPSGGTSGPGETEILKSSEFELERLAVNSDIDMLSANLAGENISLANGMLSFSNTDISIPINSSLSVNISRRYDRLSGQNDRDGGAFGDWQIDLPRIESTVLNGDHRWTPNYYANQACRMVLVAGPITAALGQLVEQHEYWNGAELTIPGQGGGKLLSGGTANYRTKDNLRVNCATASDGNEYFVVKTPNGFTYHLKQRRMVDGKPLVRRFKAATRQRMMYLVTDVYDRFENNLSYNYQGNGELQSISYQAAGSSSSEQIVSFNYSYNKISSIQVANRTWQYVYSGNNLSKVIRPDGKFWQYDFPAFRYYAASIVGVYTDDNNWDYNSYKCSYKLGYSSAPSLTLKVVHPLGAIAEFDVGVAVHGRTNMPAGSMDKISNSIPFPSYNINACYSNISVLEKRLIVQGVALDDESSTRADASYRWKYLFENENMHWDLTSWNPAKWNDTSSSTLYKNFTYGALNSYGNSQKAIVCQNTTACKNIPTNFGFEPFDLRVLTIEEPTKDKIKHYISKRWDYSENKVIATQFFQSNNPAPIKTEFKAYNKSFSMGNSNMNDPVTSANLDAIEFTDNQVQSTLEQDGTLYVNQNLSFNEYGQVLNSVSYSDNANKRYTRQSYDHDTTNWILNQPTKTEISSDGINYTTVSETSYYSKTDANYPFMPEYQKAYGVWQKHYVNYTSEGNLGRVEYNAPLTVGSGNRFIEFSNYKRGQAQTITVPQRYSAGTMNVSRIIDDNGWVEQTTDLNGNTINYGYDDLGRMQSIDSADSRWTDTLFTWSYNAGVGFNQPKRVVNRCTLNAAKTACASTAKTTTTTIYDGLLRGQEVITSGSGTTIYQNFEYNAYNKQTFASLPSTLPNETTGTHYFYDGLQRLTNEVLTDGSTQTTSYLAGNKINVNNFNGKDTTTSYLAYGSPSYEQAIKIESPENTTTSIKINVLGEVEQITQSGFNTSEAISQTETHLYNNHQLCMVKRDDVGNTYYQRKANGEISWQAEGVSGTSCAANGATAVQKTLFSYDNLGTTQGINYGDITPDKTYTLDNQGNLTKLVAGTTTWEYSYNSANMVELQTLAVDGKSFVLNPTYNSLGHITSLAYPTGRVIDFAPNAFGQPTKAGIYAHSALYHANGSLKSFTYGNGLLYSRTLDSLQRPFGLMVSSGTSAQLSLEYTYDSNSNISRIKDVYSPIYTLDLKYDDLDRLTIADRGLGTENVSYGSISYDSLGNIETKNLGSQKLTYNYEDNQDHTKKNQLKSVTGTFNYSFDYDSRGNVINNGKYALTFNQANQLTNAKDNSYIYDGHNRLVKKAGNGKTTYTVYGVDGTLLYREDSNNVKTDYIHLGSELVAEDDGNVPVPPPAPTSSPAAVTSLNGYISTCTSMMYCNFNLNWQHSAPQTVTYYELYRLGANTGSSCIIKTGCTSVNTLMIPSPSPSPSPTPSTWSKAYSGSNLQATINANATTIDFKVRACNAIGCSAYSAVKTLSTAY
jgi:hypothetical protein